MEEQAGSSIFLIFWRLEDMAVRLVPINAEQFESALRIRDLTEKHVADAIGRSKGYVWHVKGRGSINYSDAKMIEALLNIPLEEYVPENVDLSPYSDCYIKIDSNALRIALKKKKLTLNTLLCIDFSSNIYTDGIALFK